MSRLSHGLRLLPLAAAALASVATSAPSDELQVEKSTPFDGETGVPATVQPAMTIAAQEEAPEVQAGWLRLVEGGGGAVRGRVERTRLADDSGYHDTLWELRFVPAAPLPPGDYTLVLDGAAYSGPDTAYAPDGPIVARFSTLSRPVLLRHERLDSRQAVVELSQPVDVDSLRAHLTGVDATGDVLAVESLERLPGHRHRYLAGFPAGTRELDLADGLLAADGVPVAGLPVVVPAATP
jgi:hypothetical protein